MTLAPNYIQTGDPDNIPMGKNLHKGRDGESIQLYEPTIPDYAVVAVTRIIGQAFLMPNFEFPTIPYCMKKYRLQCFPCGECDSETGRRKGSRLWLVNTMLMRLGRGSVEDAPPLPVK